MAEDNPKKPPPPPSKLPLRPPVLPAQNPAKAPETTDENSGPSEKSSTATLTETTPEVSGVRDRTSIMNIADITNSTSRVPARIVPVIQISSGAEQGRIVSLAQYNTIVLGREKDCELRVYDPSCSRKHAEIFVDPNGKVFIKDLGSTNGTKVNGKRIDKEAILEIHDGDRLQLGDSTVLRHTLMPEQDAQVQMDVYFRATRDHLTNAFNRHHFDEALDRELSYQKRSGHGLGIVLFDVDHFKKVNDTHGHPGGDEVLREIGSRVPNVIRNEDIFARVGGEEFGIIIRNDSYEGLKILAERLRIAMEKRAVDFEGRSIWFTVSVGATLVTGTHTHTASNLFQIADDALYEAKNSGRNRVVLKHPDDPRSAPPQDGTPQS